MTKPDMISCATALARLWAFIDGELEPASEAEVQAHLHVCRRCYPQFDFQHAYFQAMQRLASRPEPAGLRSATLSRIHAAG